MIHLVARLPKVCGTVIPAFLCVLMFGLEAKAQSERCPEFSPRDPRPLSDGELKDILAKHAKWLDADGRHRQGWQGTQ
jgi:hypothetical protein